MKITSSYGVEIVGINKLIQVTGEIYKNALRYLIPICNEHWDEISDISSSQRQVRAIEILVHGTREAPPVYDFDQKFPKFPIYLRRAAIGAAICIVSSYQSHVKLWEEGGCLTSKPKLQVNHNKLPTFFRGNMYREDENDIYRARIKLFVENDWQFVDIRLSKTDVDYLHRHWPGASASAPTLEKRYGKFFLRFAFEEDVKLSATPIAKQRICSVDLGINTDATCSVMLSDGKILKRKFIDFPREKDHLWHVLNRIKRFQREHGPQDSGSFWSYAKRLNVELGYKIGSAITDFAAENECDVIVFGHLDFQGKKIRGGKKQVLHMWRKSAIQDVTEHRAHRYGIRISRVNVWGTGKIAFDGSGELVRDAKNYALATFSTGKQYNADLNASYNIGARYFIREIFKTLSERAQSELAEKVPEVLRATSTSYATLSKIATLLAN